MKKTSTETAVVAQRLDDERTKQLQATMQERDDEADLVERLGPSAVKFDGHIVRELLAALSIRGMASTAQLAKELEIPVATVEHFVTALEAAGRLAFQKRERRGGPPFIKSLAS